MNTTTNNNTQEKTMNNENNNKNMVTIDVVCRTIVEADDLRDVWCAADGVGQHFLRAYGDGQYQLGWFSRGQWNMFDVGDDSDRFVRNPYADESKRCESTWSGVSVMMATNPIDQFPKELHYSDRNQLLNEIARLKEERESLRSTVSSLHTRLDGAGNNFRRVIETLLERDGSDVLEDFEDEIMWFRDYAFMEGFNKKVTVEVVFTHVVRGTVEVPWNCDSDFDESNLTLNVELDGEFTNFDHNLDIQELDPTEEEWEVKAVL